MIKSLVFAVGLCILNLVFLMISFLTTEGRPIARAAIGGIGMLCYLLAINLFPKLDSKREMNNLVFVFVFVLEIIMLGLSFLIFLAMMGMVQESLVEAGYVSSDVLHYVPESP